MRSRISADASTFSAPARAHASSKACRLVPAPDTSTTNREGLTAGLPVAGA